MGLSSKQVSSDGLGWSQTLMQAQTLELPKPLPMRRQQQQNQQQQSEPLKCPRCDSSNTKFCYYNNYNKTQPRHFCRACKRHWTKGGTLRNVPVGGGRKNKRPKKSTTAAGGGGSASASARTSTTSSALTTNTNISDRVLNTHMAVQGEHQRQNLPLAQGDQKSMSEIFYQALIRPPSSLPQQNLMNSIHLDSKNFINNNGGIFFGSSSSLPVSENQSLRFPFSSSISFNSNPSSISTSFQSSNVYNYPEELKTVEEQTISRTATQAQPWQIPATSSGIDMTSYWNWDDINTFASADLNIPWDDSDIKP